MTENALRLLCDEAMTMLREVWTAGSAEGRLAELWNLAGRMDAVLDGATPVLIPEGQNMTGSETDR